MAVKKCIRERLDESIEKLEQITQEASMIFNDWGAEKESKDGGSGKRKTGKSGSEIGVLKGIIERD